LRLTQTIVAHVDRYRKAANDSASGLLPKRQEDAVRLLIHDDRTG
jgi:hypothetical protein